MYANFDENSKSRSEGVITNIHEVGGIGEFAGKIVKSYSEVTHYEV